MGVLSLNEALLLAEQKKLDLIQVTEKLETPVCKLGDHGKYLYWLAKKQKGGKNQGGETKGVRLSFGISLHDMETKAKQAEKFLKQGNKIAIEMVLHGREKALSKIAREKTNQFLEILDKLIPIKTEGNAQKRPKGFTIIITKS